jgi:putative hemolysin
MKRALTTLISLAAATTAFATETKTTLANPAATFCIENGGTYQLSKDESGNAVGICILADGSKVDAWDYIRAHFKD